MNNDLNLPDYKSNLKELFIDFILYKQLTGRKIRLYAVTLKVFDNYCIQNNWQGKTLVQSVVNDFLTVNSNRKMSSVKIYASVLREFGRYLVSHKDMKNVFIPRPLGSKKSTYIPYIFTRPKIKLFLNSASSYQCNRRLHPNMQNVIRCLYTFLYCTGMRIGEALNLKYDDINIEKRIINVTETKNNQDRLIPISVSLNIICQEYLNSRSSIHDIYFFDSGSYKNAGKITTGQAYYYFRKILEQSNIPHRGKGEGPRLHDLRHTFAVHSLENLSRLDNHPTANIEYLSKYLGHKSIYETQNYLWLTNEVAQNMLNHMSDVEEFLFNRKDL